MWVWAVGEFIMKRTANGFSLLESLLALLCMGVCVLLLSICIQSLSLPERNWQLLQKPISVLEREGKIQ